MTIIIHKATGEEIKLPRIYKLEETGLDYKVWTEGRPNTPNYFPKREVISIGLEINAL